MVKETDEELKQLILERVNREFDEHPFIVFMVKDDKQLFDELQSICKEKKAPFVHIYDVEEAFSHRQLYNEAMKGVFILEKEFSRGYDLKLGTEALVVIFANSASITHV